MAMMRENTEFDIEQQNKLINNSDKNHNVQLFWYEWIRNLSRRQIYNKLIYLLIFLQLPCSQPDAG